MVDKAPSEAQLLLDEIESFDPFARKDKEDVTSPGPADEREFPKAFKPVSDEDLKVEFPELPEMWWVVRKVGTPMKTRDHETGEEKEIFAAWKPRLAEQDCCGIGIEGKNNAFRLAIEKASEVIRSKNQDMKVETISFDVVGPLHGDKLPSAPDLKLRQKGITRNLAESNVHAIVSSRVYNRNPDSKNFLQPQITMVARGKNTRMSENDFGSRFPGGRIPFEEIKEFTRKAAAQTLPPPPTDDSDPEYTRLYNQVMSSAPSSLQALVDGMDKRLAQEKN